MPLLGTPIWNTSWRPLRRHYARCQAANSSQRKSAFAHNRRFRRAGVRAVLRLPDRVWRTPKHPVFQDISRGPPPSVDHRRSRSCSASSDPTATPQRRRSGTQKPGTLRSAVEAEVEKLLPHGKAKAGKRGGGFGPSALRTHSRGGWLMKGQHTARSSTNCGKSLAAQRISTIQGCRLGRLHGCSAMRVRRRSIMLSSGGPAGRLPLIGTGKRGRSLLA